MRKIYWCRNLMRGTLYLWLPDLPPPGQAMVEGHGHQFCSPIHLAWMEATFGYQNSAHKKRHPGRVECSAGVPLPDPILIATLRESRNFDQ